MKNFTVHQGLVAPMDRENVDTDAIIPKQFLKSIRKTGFGQNLFDEWRYLDAGFPGQDPASRKPNPDFVLNQPRYAGASILLARKNFGCGSSREHAPWALLDFGVRCVISTSFADIFKSNALKNGILPIVLPAPLHATLMQIAKEDLAATVTINLASATLTTPDGTTLTFPIDAFSQKMLLEGLDELDYIRTQSDKIVAHETSHPGTINTLQPNTPR